MLEMHSSRSPGVRGSSGVSRGEWLLLGAGAMAVGAGLHAAAGLVEIIKETWGIKPSYEKTGEAGADSKAVPGTASWILFGAITLGAAALLHAVASLVEIIKEILQARPSS
ncbi:hypothetical protein [Kitasatospora purpeofusca]|uniref:hypothetical protein n=1 Tax=Kitasatospora purpeofusca TaxID=67352 RepID=UPI00224CFEE0|nr:hypothetical protein [Kitasatospora purpeofusca]MCX4757215.1 hypothetical protein [Kitasatospora purpeofusca]WSR37606.1 hypothetical protein OG715_31185 [Kitasatospora purpeofusca]